MKKIILTLIALSSLLISIKGMPINDHYCPVGSKEGDSCTRTLCKGTKNITKTGKCGWHWGKPVIISDKTQIPCDIGWFEEQC